MLSIALLISLREMWAPKWLPLLREEEFLIILKRLYSIRSALSDIHIAVVFDGVGGGTALELPHPQVARGIIPKANILIFCTKKSHAALFTSSNTCLKKS
jgi:hypothetical protein